MVTGTPAAHNSRHSIKEEDVKIPQNMQHRYEIGAPVLWACCGHDDWEYHPDDMGCVVAHVDESSPDPGLERARAAGAQPPFYKVRDANGYGVVGEAELMPVQLSQEELDFIFSLYPSGAHLRDEEWRRYGDLLFRELARWPQLPAGEVPPT